MSRAIRATVATLPDARTLIVAQDVTDAKRIDAIRRDFVANASHEMKTPVAGILAAAETLHDAIREDPAEAERFAANLAKEARRLSNLIQDLLDLARLDQVPAEARVTRMSELVRRVVDEAGDDAREKHLDLESHIAADVEVAGRPGDLELLTRNLLDNAIRYTTSFRKMGMPRSPSATAALGSPPKTCLGSSSASTGSIRRAHEKRGEPDLGSRSFATSQKATGGR